MEDILELSNYDIKTHCQHPEVKEKKHIRRIKKFKRIGNNNGIPVKDTIHEDIKITEPRKSKEGNDEQLEASEPGTSKDTNNREGRATEPSTLKT